MLFRSYNYNYNYEYTGNNDYYSERNDFPSYLVFLVPFIFMFISIVFKPSSAPSFYTDINVTDYKDKYHRDIPYVHCCYEQNHLSMPDEDIHPVLQDPYKWILFH